MKTPEQQGPKRKILITGAGGFLGRFFCRELEKQGHLIFKTSSKTCDLTKENALKQFEGEKLDWIIHLAAWTQAGDFCLKHPGEQWLINQKINTNVLAFWQEQMPRAKLLAMGTSCAYDPKLPLQEEYYLEGKPIESLFTYAMAKRMLYAGILALHQQYGLNYLYLVPSTLYGPEYHLDGRQMHFIFDLIRKILKGKYLNEEVVLWGDGHQKRELVQVGDFVRTALNLMQTLSNQIVNLGSGEEYSIREFAKKICFLTGYDFTKIKFDLTRYVGAKSKVLSIEKIRSLLPGAQKTPLEEGLKETIGWFLKNKEKILK
ncbi:MAG: NAD-dependent epimerase/dehydratase family protein [Parachlamydiales bacterium]|jgi:GDP-L-fucose synthase